MELKNKRMVNNKTWGNIMENNMFKEKKFYAALEEIFVGAKIEGDSGFVNLLKIKEKYYSSILNRFKEDIYQCDEIKDSFREELFDKLYSFFEKYFSESGSVYFVKTANWQRVYERVYTDNKDVVLFWKTHMLYYIKSDILFNSIDVLIEDENSSRTYNFYFDAGNLQSKQNNEKRKVIYEFKEIKVQNYKDENGEKKQKNIFVFNVMYSVKGRITKIDQIVKETNIPDTIIKKAFKTFEKQSEVDFFINKNAHDFLVEQLDLYLHQFLLNDENKFEQSRLNQIKLIKKFALKIIKFISQFENELVRVWNKPKFVLNSNYVISLKTMKKYLNNNDYEKIIEAVKLNIIKNEEYKNDIIETIRDVYKQPLQKVYVYNVSINDEIKISYVKQFNTIEKLNQYLNSKENECFIDESISDRTRVLGGFFASYSEGNLIREVPFESIYVDTKYFSTEFTQEFLSMLSNYYDIDDIIDGYLINSDNYQFLNSANKFADKIDLVYIDPPFNTEGSSYAYLDKFKDSTWLSMLSDRLKLTKGKFLSNKGNLFIHLDHHCNYLGRIITEEAFGKELNREIIWNTSPSLSGLKTAANNFIRQHDTILFYSGDNAEFNKMYVNYKNKKIDGLGWLDIFKDKEEKLFIYKYKEGESELSKFYIEDIPVMAIGDVWNDVYSMMYTQNMTRENWGIDNTQKPENLLRRIIQASTYQNDYVMDYYVGTGTAIAAAHKLNRKWIGVESGDFIEDVTLKRMKTIVMGDIRPKLSIDINWQGGGFFKYYTLEQYEDTLRNMKYKDNQVSIFNDKRPFEDYIFFADNKLADVLEIEKNNIELNFDKLYKNIDWAETFSNLYGLPIKKVYSKSFILQDGEDELRINIDFAHMSKEEKIKFIQLAKSLFWWGE